MKSLKEQSKLSGTYNIVFLIGRAIALGLFSLATTLVLLYLLYPGKVDYIFVFLLGVTLSAIELGSRYKDEPISVMKCPPGTFYLVVNGMFCCLGLFLMSTFSLEPSLGGALDVSPIDDFGDRVLDVIYAAFGTFCIMRSSFLKLGSDNSQGQIDLGLNMILKKLIDIIDRQVDRDQAKRRSSDITSILKNVTFDSLSSRVHPFCLQVMQNVPENEIQGLYRELQAISTSDKCDETKKMALGLLLYNIVGRSLFLSVINDLDLSNSRNDESVTNPDDFKTNFTGIVSHVKKGGNNI